MWTWAFLANYFNTLKKNKYVIAKLWKTFPDWGTAKRLKTRSAGGLIFTKKCDDNLQKASGEIKWKKKLNQMDGKIAEKLYMMDILKNTHWKSKFWKMFAPETRENSEKPAARCKHDFGFFCYASNQLISNEKTGWRLDRVFVDRVFVVSEVQHNFVVN